MKESREGSRVGAEKVGDTQTAAVWGCTDLSMRHREAGQGREMFFLL